LRGSDTFLIKSVNLLFHGVNQGINLGLGNRSVLAGDKHSFPYLIGVETLLSPIPFQDDNDRSANSLVCCKAMLAKRALSPAAYL
jgi:hypothetical protein